MLMNVATARILRSAGLLVSLVWRNAADCDFSTTTNRRNSSTFLFCFELVVFRVAKEEKIQKTAGFMESQAARCAVVFISVRVPSSLGSWRAGLLSICGRDDRRCMQRAA